MLLNGFSRRPAAAAKRLQKQKKGALAASCPYLQKKHAAKSKTRYAELYP
jgi:hypothetical protein